MKVEFPASESMMVTKSKARVSKEDIDLIREMYTMMGEMKGILEGVQEQTAENTRTLRGHNGTEGVLTQIVRMQNDISNVDGKIEDVKKSVGALKEVPAAIERWTRYPSLTWMVRHKFKEMSVITAAAVALTILVGFPNYYVGERLQMLIELLFAKWLRL
jgi:hypothetical protein